MEKLYYTDQYIREFTANIIDIKEVDSKFHVKLDKTAFFPGGGGQFGDLGKIDVHEVIDIYEESGEVYHVLEKKPIKLKKVKCNIDWEKREDGMNQHFAQHVLSGCFFKLFNANTVGFHLGREVSTVDIEGILNEEKIIEAQAYANEIIKENIHVEILTPTKKDLKKMGLRRELPKTDEQIRVVKIGELDINACCGIHPKSTLDLRMIKIKRFEKCRNATRIEYVAGERAIEYVLEKDRQMSEICKYLKCSDIDAIKGIKNLSDRMQELQATNKKIEEEIARYHVKEKIENSEKVNGVSIIKDVYINENIKYISKLAGKLVENENIVSLNAIKDGERVNFIFAASKNIEGLNMSDLLKDSIKLVDGRGGGSSLLAQGGGRDNGNVESVIEYAFMKIKNMIK